MLSNAMFDVGGSFGHSTVIGAVINPVKWGLVSSSSSSDVVAAVAVVASGAAAAAAAAAAVSGGRE